MVVPILIVIVAFGGSALASARRLPKLAAGRVGSMAFAVVCCLVGIAVALISAEVYVTVRAIGNAATVGGLGNHKADLVATGLIDILRGAGPIIGLAAAVYLLAPAAGDADAAPQSARA